MGQDLGWSIIPQTLGLFFFFDVEMCVQNLVKYRKYHIFLTVLKDFP